MATDLYLIRHGQSYANVTPIIGGMQGDGGLTDLGHRQARLLADRLRAEQFRADVLYCSTLPRARETVTPVAEAIGIEPSYDDELQELRPGDADGLTVEEWQERWPPPAGERFFDPYDPFATNGESWASFIVRASAALAALLDRHPDETVAIVTHGGVISASFYFALGLGPAGGLVSFAPANTSITRWRHDRGTRHPAWTLIGFNDAAHLGTLPRKGEPRAVPAPISR